MKLIYTLVCVLFLSSFCDKFDHIVYESEPNNTVREADYLGSIPTKGESLTFRGEMRHDGDADVVEVFINKKTKVDITLTTGGYSLPLIGVGKEARGGDPVGGASFWPILTVYDSAGRMIYFNHAPPGNLFINDVEIPDLDDSVFFEVKSFGDVLWYPSDPFAEDRYILKINGV